MIPLFLFLIAAAVFFGTAAIGCLIADLPVVQKIGERLAR